MKDLPILKYSELQEIMYLDHENHLNGVVVDDASLDEMLRIEKTMCFNRYDAADTSDINYLTMDMYVRSPGQTAYRRDDEYSGKGFREFLESRGVIIIRISKEDADHYANNFLTIDARKIP